MPCYTRAAVLWAEGVGALQDAHRQRIIDWINAAGGTATAFDVTTKGILHAVFQVLSLF